MDWVGFLISALALVFLFFKNKPSASDEVRSEEEEEVRAAEPEENPLHEYLQAVEAREKKRVQQQRAEPPRRLQPTHKQHERIEERHLVSPLKDKKIVSEAERRHLTSPLKSRTVRSSLHSLHEQEIVAAPPRIRLVLNRLKDKQDLFLCHEIFKNPKGLE